MGRSRHQNVYVEIGVQAPVLFKMKKIGVISDTHLSETGRRSVPERVFEYFKGVDFIVHAGDFTARRAWRDLETIAPLVGVRGNNDPAHLELPRTRRFQVEGITIGLSHGDRGTDGYHKPMDQFPGNGTTAANAWSLFEFDGDVDCLIFGHSHNPMAVWHRQGEREILFLNPGSPTDKRWGPHYGCAVLTVKGTELEPELYLW